MKPERIHRLGRRFPSVQSAKDILRLLGLEKDHAGLMGACHAEGVVHREFVDQSGGGRTHAAAVLITAFLFVSTLHAQDIPVSSAKPWNSGREAEFAKQLQTVPKQAYALDANHIYTLAELVDLAESHNPDTRVAWQNAKARAQSLGVAKSALLPTLSAVALARTSRQATLYATGFYRDTYGIFEPALSLDYLIFDFGRRSGAINVAKDEMYAVDFAFNDTHRKIIYQVAAGYYRLLNAMGQQEAAKATLLNAQTVEKDAQSRLDHGLATLPDLLEAQAASAQADFDLQAAIGAQETAQGYLATTLGLPPDTNFQVQDINDLPIPDALTDTADVAIDRALAQRPDLLEQVARVRAADASIQAARSSYFPSLSFSGIGGLERAYGRRSLYPDQYDGMETWNVGLTLQWTLFDGTRREHAVAEAKAQRAGALAQVDSLRDQISDEVWRAYSDTKTALRQKRAAAALLASADKSYSAALKAYNLGLRNLLDVVSAQRALAQARSADVFARTQVLTQISNLAFRTGDLLRTPSPRQNPQP
jgi:outer membrane protein TolC